MSKFVLLGGGGFSLELQSFMKEDGHKVLGYYALEESADLKGVIPWLGSTDCAKSSTLDRSAEYIVAVRLLKYRRKFIKFIKDNQLKAGTFIHSEAYCSPSVQLGSGAVVFPRAMLSGNAKAGEFLFMDSLSIISHGDVLGNNVVIGPSVTICGDCMIGDNVTFGVNSAILPGTVIESNCEIAVNTYPTRFVKENSTILTQPGKNIGIVFNKNFR
ncbi:MAG: hypothetical protein IJJ06_09270 [Mogibacterium sp.]|nr:hypothetical protein [Mogibacterium sp.]